MKTEPSAQGEPHESRGGRPAEAGSAGRALRAGKIAGDVALRLCWLLLAAGFFWLLGFSIYVDVTVLLGLIWLAIRTQKAKLAALLVSSALAIGLLELVVQIGAHFGQVDPYFRPNEKLAVIAPRRPNIDPPVVRYQSNADIIFSMPHGDLVAMDSWLSGAVREPRTVRFITDQWGFRNDRGYAGQPYFLAGDSIVVSNGTDQAAMLANVLRDEHGLLTYSVAHPADPDQYFDNLVWAYSALNPPPATWALVFLFECNDFVSRGQRPWRPLPVPRPYDTYKLQKTGTLASWARSPGIVFNVTRRFERTLVSSGAEVVEVHEVGEHQVAFLGHCIDATFAEPLHLYLTKLIPEPIVQRIAAAFLVPSKYRVYAPLFDDGRREPTNPPAALVGLRANLDPLHIPVFDLTPALQAEARRLLPEGKYVYWRDDTHWNPAGIRVGAQVVARAVRGLEPRPLPTLPLPSPPLPASPLPSHAPPPATPSPSSMPSSASQPSSLPPGSVPSAGPPQTNR